MTDQNAQVLAGRRRVVSIDPWSIGAVVIAGLVMLPILVVVGMALFPAENVWPHLISTTLPRYVMNTGILMVCVAALAAAMGTGAAWLVTMYRFPGARWLEWLLPLPLAIPAYVGAYALVDFLEYAGPVQTLLRQIFGWSSARDYWFPEIRSEGGAALMLMLVLYPYVYLLARAAFLQQSGAAFMAARMLGRSHFGAFWSVALPMARPAIAGGVLLAVPPADFVLHNSLFLIAHFHNVIIGGVLFGLFAGITYWFPKATGYKLDEFWGKMSFWFWLIGFYFAFMPLDVLGLMGVTRRVSHFEDQSLQIWFQIAAFGAVLIAVGIAAFVIQLVVSFKRREALKDETGDPWDGRTLEWSTSSPPPPYNFAFTPRVHDLDAWWQMKQHGFKRPESGFIPIHMPKGTWAGVVLSAISVACGFALIWHMWLAAAVTFVALIGTAIYHTFNYDRDYYIPAEEVERIEAERTKVLANV